MMQREHSLGLRFVFLGGEEGSCPISETFAAQEVFIILFRETAATDGSPLCSCFSTPDQVMHFSFFFFLKRFLLLSCMYVTPLQHCILGKTRSLKLSSEELAIQG